MERLYIETVEGIMPIDIEIAEKYKLQKGMYSPFTRNRIVDEHGDFTRPQPEKKVEVKRPDPDEEDINGDPVEDVYLTTSEALDFAQGADSYN